MPFLFILGVSCLRVKAKWQTETLFFFDTVCEINLFCTTSEYELAKKKVVETFQDIEAHFSPDSQSYSSAQVIFLYQRASDVYRASEGCFDITVAPLSRIWGFLDHTPRIPQPKEIKKALKNIGMNRISLESDKIVLPPGMALDWGGIAKGYGIDLAAQALIRTGIKSGFINAGGDLYCWGQNPDQQSWRIGIKDPRQSGVSAVLFITDTGAATTGDYQRFFIQDGVRYHHVFDPKSGYPAKGKQSVTVVGPETLVCDALSTALFVSSQPQKIITKVPGYGAVLIDSEGTISLIGKDYPIQLEK